MFDDIRELFEERGLIDEATVEKGWDEEVRVRQWEMFNEKTHNVLGILEGLINAIGKGPSSNIRFTTTLWESNFNKPIGTWHAYLYPFVGPALGVTMALDGQAVHFEIYGSPSQLGLNVSDKFKVFSEFTEEALAERLREVTLGLVEQRRRAAAY